MIDVKLTRDVDGRQRVAGWIGLAAPEKARRIEAARVLWGTMPTKAVALASGVPYDALRRALEPGYAERRRAVVNARRKGLDASGRTKSDGSPAHITEPKPRDADVAARLAEIPEDDRGLTARLCGDPLRGRSALDKRAGVA